MTRPSSIREALAWRNVIRELVIAGAMMAAFSALFILGHLALHQELPRWK